jgi:hypothetical protein
MRVLPLVLALTTAVPSAAISQVVLADIHIGGGPVQGRVVIGHPGYYHPAPVIVSRYHSPRHVCRPVAVRYGPYRRGHPHHRVDMWFHPATGRYYDHPHPGARGLRRVSVWEDGGRHWRDD